MAPLYDYECPSCQAVFEQMAKVEEDVLACERCCAEAHRLLTLNSMYRHDASWVSDCTVPFDPQDSRPEIKAYLSNPSDRKALELACKVAGIRHAEPGELGRRREEQGLTPGQRRELIERHRTRMGQI